MFSAPNPFRPLREVVKKQKPVAIEADGFVTIFDTIIVEGFIADWTNCSTCEDLVVYSDKYDAAFCPSCNEWLESICSDPTCGFCTERPQKPLDQISV